MRLGSVFDCWTCDGAGSWSLPIRCDTATMLSATNICTADIVSGIEWTTRHVYTSSPPRSLHSVTKTSPNTAAWSRTSVMLSPKHYRQIRTKLMESGLVMSMLDIMAVLSVAHVCQFRTSATLVISVRSNRLRDRQSLIDLHSMAPLQYTGWAKNEAT